MALSGVIFSGILLNRLTTPGVICENVELLFMKGIIKLLMVLAAIIPLSLRAQGLADIVSRLSEAECYRADATFNVSVPQTDTDVAYTLSLVSSSAPADRLSPASYLIEWTLPTESGTSEGFTAYFDGNLYRYRDSRLMEYHMSWDSIPFLGVGRAQPIQISAQFAQLLPQFMARELEEMQADSRYTVSVEPGRKFDGHDAIAVKAIMKIDSETVQEKTFMLDASTFMPLRTIIEANPGSITEQTIIVDYTAAPNGESTPCPQLSEEILMEKYPEIFEKYRISNFRIENLAGSRLPQFTLPRLDGQRFAHHTADPFGKPTVLAIIDPASGGEFNPRLIEALRQARLAASVDTDLILAFATTNPDQAEALAGDNEQGETHLLNARSLARDCGAASLPVVIIVDSEANVKNVVLGFNNNMAELVIQSIELISQ